MTAALNALAAACTVGGIIVGLLVFVRVRDGRLATRAALEFWLAAGLIRLSDPVPSWSTLAAAAAIITIRQLVGYALRHPPGRRPKKRRRASAAPG